MKLKMGEAVNMYDALVKLSDTDAPFRVNYWIIKNRKELEPCFEIFVQERDKIYSECLTPDENGQLYTQDANGNIHFNIEKEMIPTWNTRFNALDDFDVEISPCLLDMDALLAENPNWNFKADTLMSLDKLFESKKSERRTRGSDSKDT